MTISISEAAKELNLPRSFIRKILNKDNLTEEDMAFLRSVVVKYTPGFHTIAGVMKEIMDSME